MNPPDPPPDRLQLDPQHPWPGLEEYTEASRGYFAGRQEETMDLAQMIRLRGAVVLSGESGLGKTSLLKAGVFPALLEADFFPVYLRLKHERDAPPYAPQVLDAISAGWLQRHPGATIPAPAAGESMWNYLNREDVEFWSPRNHLMTPVLVFDQFEEIFTRGGEARRWREIEVFLRELADLAENRPPAEEDLLQSGGHVPLGRQNHRIVLSLRKEYLSELETSLRRRMPSVMQNRFHLGPLRYDQALEAVESPARHANLIAPGAAQAIVRAVAGLRIDRVAGGTEGAATEGDGDIRHQSIEPALLCLLCSELNVERQRRGLAAITSDLVETKRDDIIKGYYLNCLADLPEAVSRLVEHLVTPSGFRRAISMDEIDVLPGITRVHIERLVGRRLLRYDTGIGGVPTVELMHDCLAPVVVSRRAERDRVDLGRERRVRRLKWLAGGMAGLAIAAMGTGLAIASRERREALDKGAEAERAREETRRILQATAMADDLHAMELGGRGDPAAHAYLARALSSNPDLEQAKTRAVGFLLHHDVPPRTLARQRGMMAGPIKVAGGIVTIDVNAVVAFHREGGAETVVSAPAPAGWKFAAASDAKDGTVLVVLEAAAVVSPADSDERNAPVTTQNAKSDATVPANSSEKAEEQKEEDSPKSMVLRIEWSTGKLAGSFPTSLSIRTAVSSGKKGEMLVLDAQGRIHAWQPGKSAKPVMLDLGTGDDSRPVLIEALGEAAANGCHAIGKQGTGTFLWNLSEGAEAKPVPVSDVPGTAVRAIKPVPGQAVLACLSDNGTLFLLKAAGGPPVATHVPKSPLRSFQPSDDGIVLLILDERSTVRWLNTSDLKECRPARPLGEAVIDAIPWNNGREILFETRDGALKTQATPGNRGIARSRTVLDAKLEVNQVEFVRVNGGQDFLVTSADDGILRFPNPGGGADLRPSQAFNGEPNPMALSADGRTLAVADNDTMYLLALHEPAKELMKVAEDIKVWSTAFSPDGTRVAFATRGGELRIHEVADGTAVGSMMKVQGTGPRLAWSPSPDRPYLAMSIHGSASETDATVHVFRLDGQELVAACAPLPKQGGIRHLAFDPTGRWLAIPCLDGTATVMDLDQPDRTPHVLSHDPAGVTAVAFHPAPVDADRPMLVSGATDGLLREWDVVSARQTPGAYADPGMGGIYSLKFSSSGRLLASTASNGSANIWETGSRARLGFPIRHSGAVWNAVFSRDEDSVFTASRDGTVISTALVPTPAYTPGLLSKLLEWQSRSRFDAEGRIETIADDAAADLARHCHTLARTAEDEALISWTLADPWMRPLRPGDPQDSCLEWRARVVQASGSAAAYDHDPADPIAMLGLAAERADPAYAAALRERALALLDGRPAARLAAAQVLAAGKQYEMAANLFKSLPAADETLETSLLRLHVLSQANRSKEAQAVLKSVLEATPENSGQAGAVALACLRAGMMGDARRFAPEDGVLSGPDAAWADVELSESGNEPSGIRRRERAKAWFESARLQAGLVAEANLALALLEFQRAETLPKVESEPLKLAAGKFLETFQSVNGGRPDPVRIDGLARVGALRQRLDVALRGGILETMSADALLGRALHLWFSGDAEGAREAYARLASVSPDATDPSGPRLATLFEYERQALRSLVGQGTPPASVEGVPTTEEEWAVAGVVPPQLTLESLPDDILAGRALLAAKVDPPAAKECVRILLGRDRRWNDRSFLKAQGWEKSEIDAFLSLQIPTRR